jgi:hypothetical protein
MKRWTVIAVTLLGVTAVAATLFFGLRSNPAAVVGRTTVAQAPPQISAAQRLEEEARTREAIRATVRARHTRKKHEREATRAAARASRAHKLSERDAGHGAPHSAAAERRAGAVDPQPTPRMKTRRHKQTHGSTPKHSRGSRPQAEAKRQLDHERTVENRERKHAEREAVRQRRREERRAGGGARKAVSRQSVP